jgi:hypothetical protein
MDKDQRDDEPRGDPTHAATVADLKAPAAPAMSGRNRSHLGNCFDEPRLGEGRSVSVISQRVAGVARR